jgi:hypothetical protein
MIYFSIQFYLIFSITKVLFISMNSDNHQSNPEDLPLSPGGSDTLSIIGDKTDYQLFAHTDAGSNDTHPVPQPQPYARPQGRTITLVPNPNYTPSPIPSTSTGYSTGPTPSTSTGYSTNRPNPTIYLPSSDNTQGGLPTGTEMYPIPSNSRSMNPTYRIRAFLVGRPSEPAMTDASFITTINLPSNRNNPHLSNPFYDHITELTTKYAKSHAPYFQITQSGFRFHFINPITTYKYQSGRDLQTFHVSIPITDSLRIMAPPPAAILNDRQQPVIDLKIFYSLNLIPPTPDRFLITAEDRTLMENFIEQAKVHIIPEVAPPPPPQQRLGIFTRGQIACGRPRPHTRWNQQRPSPRAQPLNSDSSTIPPLMSQQMDFEEEYVPY